jgi:hypothetical protein
MLAGIDVGRSVWQDQPAMGIEAARLKMADGREVILVAVRHDVLDDPTRTRAALDVLNSVFPGHLVALVTSVSEGIHVVSGVPDVDVTVQQAVRREKAPLSWKRYAFA